MARFSVIYYLFAVLVVLAAMANARPTTPTSSDLGGSVAGVPGMASVFKQGSAKAPAQDQSVDTATTTDADVAEAMQAVAAAV
jgi:hypothetical protein